MGAENIMNITETNIPGCYEIRPKISTDNRGRFIKTFQENLFRSNGLLDRFAEEFHSESRKGVVRGLHFQIPPMAQAKVVYCVSGAVLDAVVDLRVGSPTFGRFATFALTDRDGTILYIPEGLAHGFCVLSDSAIMMYKVTAEYTPSLDAGILWDSAGIPWPVSDPVLSERDRAFPRLSDFTSPFTHRGPEEN